MAIKDFVGRWEIVAVEEEEGEATFPDDVDDDYENTEFLDWLNETPTCHRASASEVASGVTLEIFEDGNFEERAEEGARLPCFDEEGVMEMNASPFDGEIVEQGGALYLRPKDLHPGVSPEDERYEVIIRYDDGDTAICDHVKVAKDNLYRTVSVTTDALYFNRIHYIYERRA